jgi:DNA-binding NtrC family response regulator
LPERGIRFEDVERDLLRQALMRTGGNRTRASALVGLTLDTFRYRMARLGLDAQGNEEATED